MTLVIRANSFFVKRYLKVKDHGIEFMETAAMGGRRKFRFDQIDFVLLSPTNVLSLQVGSEVFSIQTKPKKFSHQQAVQQLLAWVSAAQERSMGFPMG